MGRIVIIDDDIVTLEIHKTYLAGEHQVYTFDDGQEALEHIAEVKPDVVLLDIEMPFMDGFEVLEKLRQMKGCAQIPVIGVTGQRDKVTALKFLGKGAVAYLMKPIEKNLLLDKVAAVLAEEQTKKDKKKVLLVDDETESLLFYKMALQEDYNVTMLNSSKNALEYLQRFVPDLIILDYQMPLYNGRALYQMISKMERVAEVPVIFLTGTTERDVLIECATLKPRAVVLKSAGKEALLERVKSVFEEE